MGMAASVHGTISQRQHVSSQHSLCLAELSYCNRRLNVSSSSSFNCHLQLAEDCSVRIGEFMTGYTFPPPPHNWKLLVYFP